MYSMDDLPQDGVPSGAWRRPYADGVFAGSSEKKRCLPFRLRRETTCGERWRYPTRATLGRTLAGPEACLMRPVRDASLEWVNLAGTYLL